MDKKEVLIMKQAPKDTATYNEATRNSANPMQGELRIKKESPKEKESKGGYFQ